MNKLVWPWRTKRLQLRLAEPQDAADVYAYHRLPEVARYQLWDPRTREQAAERVAVWRKLDGAPGGGGLALCVVLSETGRVIGDLHLDYNSRKPEEGEIGFCFHPDHWGKGYATEAAEALLEIAFEHLGRAYVIGRCDTRNRASWALMERLGMHLHAHITDPALSKGEWEEQFDYILSKSGWRERRSRAAR